MEFKKKLWLNYVASQLVVKDKTFGHLISLNSGKKNKKNFYKNTLLNKNKKNKLICKFVLNKKKSTDLKRGTVLILLSKKLLGKKVIMIGNTDSGLLVVTGPFSINGVSIRRVNPRYTIESGAHINLDKLNLFVLNDEYFETLKKTRNSDFQSKNYKYVLSHRIRQNYIDSYIMNSLKKNFFLRAYLKTGFLNPSYK